MASRIEWPAAFPQARVSQVLGRPEWTSRTEFPCRARTSRAEGTRTSTHGRELAPRGSPRPTRPGGPRAYICARRHPTREVFV